MSDMSFNFPQIIAVALIGYLAVRWFRTPSGTTEDGNTSGRPSDHTRQLEQVQQLRAMFPQQDQRSLLWDLQRNGGNVEATSNRILEGRPLATVSTFMDAVRDISLNVCAQPPTSFRPQFPAPNAPSSATTSSRTSGRPDLITRYNLSSKLSQAEEAAAVTSETEAGVQHQTWSQDRDERAALLKKRQEEMILAARRAMEAKDRAKRAAS